MPAPQERGPLPTGNFPFSELIANPEMIEEMVGATCIRDGESGPDWAVIECGCGVSLWIDGREGKKEYWVELPLSDGQMMQLEDTEVIRSSDRGFTIVAPLNDVRDKFGGTKQCLTWLSMEDDFYSYSQKLRMPGTPWSSDIPADIQLAADRATARQHQRLVAAGNGS